MTCKAKRSTRSLSFGAENFMFSIEGGRLSSNRILCWQIKIMLQCGWMFRYSETGNLCFVVVVKRV
jgi:hypothetical protein